MSLIHHAGIRTAEPAEDVSSTPDPSEVTGDIASNIAIALAVALGASLIALALGSG